MYIDLKMTLLFSEIV